MKKNKILIIEDDRLLSSILTDILIREGFEVLVAYDGEEGLEKMKEMPDIVLLDWTMPKMDGPQTLKKIRENVYYLSIPIVFLTGRSEQESQIQGFNLGADDYIIKPFNTEILLAKIKILLKQKDTRISVNPLTKLPGNIMIKDEIEKRLLKDREFVLLYIDLKNFKAFNDYYGFSAGDKVILFTANILVSACREVGNEEDFIGHIGGDDFVIITTPDKYTKIVEYIIKKFDEGITNFYSTEDKNRGYISTYDREGNFKNFPIMTINIVGVSSQKTKIYDFEELSKRVAQLKQYAKKFDKSIFIEERRQ